MERSQLLQYVKSPGNEQPAKRKPTTDRSKMAFDTFYGEVSPNVVIQSKDGLFFGASEYILKQTW